MILAMTMPIFSKTAQLRRVKREESAPVHRIDMDPLERCLATWTAWMRRQDADLGMRGMKLATIGDTYESESDGDSVYAKADNEIAGAVDASINSLQMSHRWAIFRKQGVATAWRFPSLNYLIEAQDASVELEKKLRQNTATRALF